MTHKHKWHFFENSADGAFCVKGCHGRLSRTEAEHRINATEELNVLDARYVADELETRFRMADAPNALRAYAERMEDDT